VLNVDDAELLAFPFPRPDDCNIIHAEEVRALGPIVEDCNPFNGTLIHRDIVDKVGTPHPDFFIWGDEQEYKRRATKGGFRVLTITDSTFYHPASSGIPLPIMPLKSFWKQYYHVRNHGATATKEGDLRLSPRGAVKLANVFTIYLLKNMVSNIIKIMMIWAAVLAALFNHRRRHFK
jgi:GT2 family glycosyltransferase